MLLLDGLIILSLLNFYKRPKIFLDRFLEADFIVLSIVLLP